MTAIFSTLLSAIFLVCSATLAADDGVAPDDAESRARLAFQRGTELFSDEQYAAAADAFREAYREKPSWKIQFNIAQAESAAKRYGLALRAFELFLADGGDEIGVERKDEVLAEIRRLRLMVASVDVRGPDGARVLIDDVERGVIPLEGPIKVTAGKRHKLTVVQDESTLLERNVLLSGGDETTVEVEELPAEIADKPAGQEQPADGVPRVQETPSSVPILNNEHISAEDGNPTGPGEVTRMQSAESNGGRKLRIAGAVLMGTGGAITVLGGVMGGLSLSKTQDVKDLCDSSTRECSGAEETEAYDNAMGYGVSANILLTGGVLVAGTGLVLYLVGRKRNEKLAAVHLVPLIGESMGALVVAGKF